jgi:hypothetical protein
MQSQYGDELKWTDDDIRQLRDAVNHLVEINEELNSRCIMYDTIVKQREAALKKAKIYIEQLEMAVIKPQKPNWN